MKKKIIKVGIIIVVTTVVVAGGWFGYKYFFGENVSDVPAVNMEQLVAVVEKGEIKESITASGVVALADEFEIYAEGESNIIKEFLVEEGDNVTEGQILVNYDIDDKKEEYENKIKELEINLNNEKMSLQSISLPLSETEKKELENNIAQAEKTVYDSKVKIESYTDSINKQQITINNAQRDIDNAQKNIDNAQRTIDNAKNDYEKAQKTVDDNKELLDAGAITQDEYDNSIDEQKKASDTYDDAVQAYDNATQAYDDAVQAYDDAKTELNNINKDKESDEYTLKNAELSLSLAQTKLKSSANPMADKNNQIKYKQQQNQIALTENSLNDYKRKLSELVYSTSSMVSGLVTEICIDEGTYTEENTIMMKIANFNQLIVQASIAEYDAPNVELGQKVIMTTDGIEGKIYTGKVIKINPSASAESTTMGSETIVAVEISVDNPDGILKPGYNLDLEIITEDKENVMILPTASVIKDSENDEYYTFIINDDKRIKKTVVEVGIYGETSTEIISGINEGDRVISNASAEMRDGMMFDEAMVLSNKGNSENKSEKENQEQGGMMFGGMGGGRPSGGMGGPGPR